MAVITINTDTEITTDQNNADGYVFSGCTVILNAVAKGSDLSFIFGAGGVGDLVIEDDAKVIFRTNDTCKIYCGGTSAQKANDFKCYGIIETDYQGSTTTLTTMIGTDGTNATIDHYVTIGPQPKHVVENIYIDSTASYVLTDDLGAGLLWKNCKIGTHCTYCFRPNKSNIVWFEDCEFVCTNASYYCFLLGGCEVNLVGNCNLNGKTHQISTYMEIIRYWNRAYVICKDDSGNELEDTWVSLIQNEGYNARGGKTASDGKIDEDNEMWGQDYLIGLWKTEDDFNGTITYANASLKHKLLTYLSGYTTSSTEVDMSSDYGSSSAFETITMAATTTPIISSPAFDDVTITQDQELTCTCTSTNTDYAYIEFTDPGTDTDTIYTKEFTKDGDSFSVTIPPGSLKTGTYDAGEIRIVAVNTSGESDIDSTLILTVSDSDAPALTQIITALETYYANNFPTFDFYPSLNEKKPSKAPFIIVRDRIQKKPLMLLDDDKRVKEILITQSVVIDFYQFTYSSLSGEEALEKLLDDICDGLENMTLTIEENEIKKRRVEITGYKSNYEWAPTTGRNLFLLGGEITFSTTIIE